MITTLLVLGLLCFASIGVLIFQALHAPEGREDAAGFHYSRGIAPQFRARAAHKVDEAHGSAHGATQQVPAM
jgi:hypothetical protein